MAESHCSSTQLLVDEAILEYLIFAATHSLVENAKSALANKMYFTDEAQVEMLLEMVDCLPLFNILSRQQ